MSTSIIAKSCPTESESAAPNNIKPPKRCDLSLTPDCANPVLNGWCLEGIPEQELTTAGDRQAMRALCIGLIFGKIAELEALQFGSSKASFFTFKPEQKGFPLVEFVTTAGKFSWTKTLLDAIENTSTGLNLVAEFNTMLGEAKLFAVYNRKASQKGIIYTTSAWSRFDIHLYRALGPEQRNEKTELSTVPLLRAFAIKLENNFKKWKAKNVGKQIECLATHVKRRVEDLRIANSASAKPPNANMCRASGDVFSEVKKAVCIAQDHSLDGDSKHALSISERQFSDYVAAAAKWIDSSNWWIAFKDSKHAEHKAADLTVRIGSLQRRKLANRSARLKLAVEGDDESFLLESTIAVFRAATLQFPEMRHFFDCLMSALGALDCIEESASGLRVNFSRKY